MEDEDEIINPGDEKYQVPAERKESLESSQKTSGHDVQKQEKTEVTLTVAECGEFHALGEFHEHIRTVEEDVAIWKQIPLERINGICAIGINIHTPGTKPSEDVAVDVLYGKRIDLDILEYIPEVNSNPRAMEVIVETGEKSQKEATKREQEQSVPKVSLKARLEEKRTQVLLFCAASGSKKSGI